MAWKILISDSLAQEGIDYLKDLAEVDDKAGISPEDLANKIGGYDALIVRGRTMVTQDILTLAKNLKVVGRAGVGVDNIDLEATKAHSIVVVNAPTATSNAVAEHVIGLMLSLARHIPQANASMKDGKWDKKAFKGFELSGKTLGIIGMGRIGSNLAKLAKAFSMHIVGYDPFLSDQAIQENYATPASIETIYDQSDIISLHLPLNKDTRGMLNKNAFSKMKVGTRIICAARGGIIDENELLKQLNSGHIAGAALDVFENEPPGLTNLISHPNVITTPHIGAQTNEAQIKAALDIAEEVLNSLENKPLRWQVI